MTKYNKLQIVASEISGYTPDYENDLDHDLGYYKLNTTNQRWKYVQEVAEKLDISLNVRQELFIVIYLDNFSVRLFCPEHEKQEEFESLI